jgi:ribosome-associated protein
MPKLPDSDPAPEPEDAEDLRSRTDERKDRLRAEQDLMDLAQRLVELAERSLGKLELPDDLLDAIRNARAIRSPPARKRALRVVRTALRDGDAQRIKKQLARSTHVPRAAADVELDAWCERLQSGGDAELGAFLELHPEADRQQLRQLARKAAKADPPSKAASMRALKLALARQLR